jgi:CubicO group peptidase (beta-lactamase class C family)
MTLVSQDSAAPAKSFRRSRPRSGTTLDLLAAPAAPPASGVFDDDLFRGEVRFSLGFMKPGRVLRFGGPRAFGFPGAGAAFGYADPDAGVGYGYVTSQMGTTLTGDPRDVALRDALSSALRSHEGLPSAPERRAS